MKSILLRPRNTSISAMDSTLPSNCSRWKALSSKLLTLTCSSPLYINLPTLPCSTTVSKSTKLSVNSSNCPCLTSCSATDSKNSIFRQLSSISASNSINQDFSGLKTSSRIWGCPKTSSESASWCCSDSTALVKNLSDSFQYFTYTSLLIIQTYSFRRLGSAASLAPSPSSLPKSS